MKFLNSTANLFDHQVFNSETINLITSSLETGEDYQAAMKFNFLNPFEVGKGGRRKVFWEPHRAYIHKFVHTVTHTVGRT